MVDQEIPRETDEPTSCIDRYGASRLAFKRETTRNTYTIILRQFLTWLSNLPGHELSFNPALDLTQTAVQTYLFGELTDMSVSHRERVKSILSSFAEWLIDEAFITRNPTRGIEFPAQQLLAPRELETSQRYLLKERATRQQWEQITDITFHDLRHDFGHRLRASGFTLEEVAVSLGHVTKKGTPAVATTARYTQPNREQMKHKLKDILL